MSIDGKNENLEASESYISCLGNVLKAPNKLTLSQVTDIEF
jgi:hypothetical protein